MNLLIEDFKPIALEDKPLFYKHYLEYPPIHSDNLFTTLISWNDYGNYHFTFYEKNLIIISKIGNNIQIRSPSGKHKKHIFEQVLHLAKREGSKIPFVLIDNQTKEWLSQQFPKLQFTPDRDYFDYVYLTSDLAELPGSKYSKIRNRFNKFKKNYQYTTEKISDDNISEIRQFLKRWCLWKDCESDPILEHEKKAILYSIGHFFKLGLSGINIRIEGNIESIAVYEKLNPDTAIVHYEKGSPDYDGIYKAINAETAKILQKDFKFINRESDMGIPGLRQAKMSYHPYHMTEVFYVDRQNIIV